MNNAKKVFDWFKDLFTKSKEKGLGATLMGPFVGFLRFLDTLGKKDEKSAPTETARPAEAPAVAETQTQLEQLQSSLPALFDHTKFESKPYEVSERTGITLCSGTALKNLEMLGFGHFFRAKDALESLKKNPNQSFEGIPTGDAIDVRNFYIQSRQHEKITGGTTNDGITSKLDSFGKPIADILVDSTSPYDHRAVAFKSSKDRKWYILDPYRADRSTKPIPFEQYQGKILLAIPLRPDSRPSIPLSPDATPESPAHNAKNEALFAKLRQKAANENLDIGSRILFAVELAMKENILGENCWDWADKVYTIADIPQTKRRIIFNSAGEHGLNCGEFPAEDKTLSQLEPGDWVYTHNRNYKDFNGNHSMIFVEWIDKEKRIAKMASCHGKDQPGSFDQRYDFNRSPVVFISKPALSKRQLVS